MSTVVRFVAWASVDRMARMAAMSSALRVVRRGFVRYLHLRFILFHVGSCVEGCYSTERFHQVDFPLSCGKRACYRALLASVRPAF